MNRTIKAMVFDIDGTLAMMDKQSSEYTALPGAVAAVQYCHDHGIAAVAYTNGTFFPPAHYYPKLESAGFHFEANHILTPAAVAAHVLSAAGYRRVMVLGAEGTTQPIEEAGIEVVNPLDGASDIDAIMLGWCKAFSSNEVEAICTTLWEKEVPLYAASVAPYFASAKGRLLGISGAVAAMVEYTTGVKATVIGKPSTAGLDMISRLTGVAAAEMAVIGDDPKLEIKMARLGGALAVGVTTGLNDEAAFAQMPEEHRATQIIATLEDIPKMLPAR